VKFTSCSISVIKRNVCNGEVSTLYIGVSIMTVIIKAAAWKAMPTLCRLFAHSNPSHKFAKLPPISSHGNDGTLSWESALKERCFGSFVFHLALIFTYM